MFLKKAKRRTEPLAGILLRGTRIQINCTELEQEAELCVHQEFQEGSSNLFVSLKDVHKVWDGLPLLSTGCRVEALSLWQRNCQMVVLRARQPNLEAARFAPTDGCQGM